jgi:Transglycosylase SLT domain
VQVTICVLLAATLSLTINWIYQVIHKPSELFFPVSGTLNKTPSETWRQYEPAFEKYSTSVMSPELLAALAQVEGSGNPIARTYWRWSWTVHPFGVYRPASSAVGMYQITDGTFAEAKRYCIRDHVVVEDGAWKDWSSCWFNNFYVRVIPSHAIELTSAYLDRAVVSTLDRHRLTTATPLQKQELAAVIHLCGSGAGDLFARHHFRLNDGQKCGDHEVRVYVARVNAMKSVFTRLEAAAGQ